MTPRTKEILRRVQADPLDASAAEAARRELMAVGDHKRLESLLRWRAATLRDRGAPSAVIADVHRSLARLRLEHLKDSAGAVSAYQDALTARPEDLEAMHELATLYVDRARATGVEEEYSRAATLYYGVACWLEGQDAVPYLEAALDCDPAHEQSLDMLELLAKAPGDKPLLVQRWLQFIQHAGEGRAVDNRRVLLAREYTAAEKLEEAMRCLEPLAARGVSKAQEAVENLRRRIGGGSPASRPAPSASWPDEDAATIVRPALADGGGLASPFGRDPFASPPSSGSTELEPTDPMARYPQHPARPGGQPAPARFGGVVFHGPSVETELTTDESSWPPKTDPSREHFIAPPKPPTGRIRQEPAESRPARRRKAKRPRPEPAYAPAVDHHEPPPPSAPVELPRDGLEPILYSVDEDEIADREELEFEEPFPVQVIVAGDAVAAPMSSARKTQPVLEVIRISDGRVVGSDTLRWPGQRLRPRGAPFSVVRGSQRATLRLRRSSDGALWRAGRQPGLPPEELPPPGQLRLELDDVVEVREAPVTWRIRLFRPKSKPPAFESWNDIPWKVYGACAGLAVFQHLLVLGFFLGLASLGVSFRVEDRPQEEIFAEVRMRVTKLPPTEQPRPRPERRRERRLQERPPEPEEEQVRIPRSLRTKLRQIARERDGEQGSTDRLVNALRSPVQGAGQSLSEVVSNIDAAEGGADSGAFRVGGTLAALEGAGVNIASGGGGDIGTVGGQTATKNLDRMEASGGPVRGRVRGVQALARVQGSLSRGEVLAVINRAIGRIQRCYERALTTNPSLAGQVTFAWTIQPSGSVSGVSQTSSTLSNPAVSTCISGVIRGLRFPQPQGGPVTVAFPFMFQRVP